MPKHDVPLDITFIVSIWLEALIYGFFMCLFAGTMYVNVTLRRAQDYHSKIMFYAIILMFVISTVHVALDCNRLIEAYVIHRLDPGGPVAWMSNLSSWQHISKDALYVTQELLGDSAAIYRTYIVWRRNWKAIVVPCCLLIVSTISGYTVIGTYPSETSDNIFDPRLVHWIDTFYCISVIQSGMATSLIAFRIWQTNRRAALYRATKEGSLMPILWILVESASIQFVAELILFVLYMAGYGAQYMLLEPGTPLVGITFCAITIRIALYQSDMSRGSRDRPSQGATSVDGPIPTIGSIPMRPLPISINITKEIEAHADSHSGSPTPGDIADGVYNMDGKPRSSNSGDESFMHVA